MSSKKHGHEHLKVLHSISSLSIQDGGPQYILTTVANGLVEAGHAVTIATMTDNPNIETVHDRMPSASVKMFSRFTFLGVSFSLGLSKWFGREISKFDVVHLHSFFTFSTLAAAYAAHRSKTPYVIWLHGSLDSWSLKQKSTKKKLFMRVVGNALLRGASAVHTTCNAEEEALRSMKVVSDDCIFNIPIGISFPKTVEKKAQNDYFTWLFLSRIHPKKNVEQTLRSFAVHLQSFPEDRLKIAGLGDEGHIATLQELARALGLEDSVDWLGWVDGEEKKQIIRDSDVFVLPSYDENFGIAVAEAMGLAVPVIITRQTGISQFINDSQGAIIYDVHDSDELSEAMARIRDRDLQTRMGAAARQTALSELSAERMIGRIVKMYRGIVAKKT